MPGNLNGDPAPAGGRRGEAALGALMQTLPGFLYRCRPARTAWDVEYVSDGVRALTGFGPEAFRPGGPMTFTRVIDPADLARVSNEIRGALAARRTYQITYAMVDAEGRRRRVWELGRGLWNAAGELEAVDGYVAELGGAGDAGRPKVLDLTQMVEGLAAFLGRFYGEEVALELVASGDGGRTWVDAGGAEQVVLKVVASGSDVVPRRGWVRLSVSRDPGSDLARRTGLGLASVDVACGEDGQGPAAEDDDAPVAPDDRRQVLLLVEDDARVRRILHQLLEGEGYVVLPAAGADEALEVARRAPRIDLLITDVVMPEVSGPELAERLATVRPGLPVLYVSGYTGKAFSATTLLPPTVAFLPKPVVPGRLFEKVRQILDRVA